MKISKSSIQHKSSARSPLVPHVAFWIGAFLIKLLFPVYLKWLAYDSITILLLSVWYPLCATISLIHRDKCLRQKQNERIEISNDGIEIKREGTESLQMERQFWIEYWSVGFAGVQFLRRVIMLIPPLQQIGRDYPQLPVILNEIELLFFTWIFAMETLLKHHQFYAGIDENKRNMKKFLPLAFLTKSTRPKLMRLQMAISEQISKDTWQRLIKRKAQRVLEVMVMLQLLEAETMEYMLQLLEEGRSLLLLSVFMVLPSSISQIGLLYVQFIFPSARSLLLSHKRDDDDDSEILSLKYWVLNSILSVFFSLSWWIWWCVPFSNQLLLGIRCFATFPSTIRHYYRALELELVAFGILSGEEKVTVKETKTVQALRAVVKRLPRDKHASSFQFEIDELDSQYQNGDEDSSIGSVDTTESEIERKGIERRQKRAKKKKLKQKQFSGMADSDSARSSPTLEEERDARDAATVDTASQVGIRQVVPNSLSDDTSNLISAFSLESGSYTTFGSNYSSSQVHTTSKSTKMKIATPTENVVGEVEVQVKRSNISITNSMSSGSDFLFPSASYESELNTTSTDNEVNSFIDSDEVPTSPRRASRLTQLREWQERKQKEKTKLASVTEKSLKAKSSYSDKQHKKSKRSKKKPSPESNWDEGSTSDGSPSKASKSSSRVKKVRKSTSPKKSKATSSEGESVATKMTAASLGKRVKKKSSVATPERKSKSPRKKDEASPSDNTSRVKPKKVPNSRKKKKDISTMLGL